MNILTFDIEEWYLELIQYGGREDKYRQFDEAFTKLIDELDRLGIKATFFCVGKLAKLCPNVVKTISEKGHEVGCHSNEHIWLNKMSEEELRQDTKDALDSLEDLIGQKVISYRAPAFSITPKNKWAVNILSEYGIKIDASFFPTSRELGGYTGFPQDTPCIIEHEGTQMKEFPICLTNMLGKTIAYSGGGYFRLLPYLMVNRTMKSRDYNICYFHLSDLVHETVKMMSKEEYEAYFKEPGTLKNRFVRYMKSNVGTGDAYGKMVKLLSNHSFVNLKGAERIIDWNKITTIKL